MKAIESYGGWKMMTVLLPGLFVLTHFLAFLQVMMQTFIRPNERAQKMLRIHHSNLFHIRRSLHLIFGIAVTAIWHHHGTINTHIYSRHIL